MGLGSISGLCLLDHFDLNFKSNMAYKQIGETGVGDLGGGL